MLVTYILARLYELAYLCTRVRGIVDEYVRVYPRDSMRVR